MDRLPHEELRTLTPADVEAIAQALESRLVKRFYLNLGKGVFGLFWKACIAAIVVVSAYGALKSGGVIKLG